MIRKPNAFQKLLHHIVMLRPVTAFFATKVHLLDKAVLGWNIVQLITIGAKTNQRHSMPLVGVFEGEKVALIASSFGRKHNPGWYYNLKAHPECDISYNGHVKKYVAREITGEEYERYWQLA